MGYHLTTTDDARPSRSATKYPVVTRKTHRGPISRWVLSSKYTDSETGLLYYGYRYYQLEIGRWASRDPIGEDGGVNICCFNGNDPIDRNDILGLACSRANDCVPGQTRTLNTNCKIKGVYTGTPHVQWAPDYGTFPNKMNQDAVCTCSVKGALYCDTETLPCIQWEYPCPGLCNSVVLKQFYSWDTHGIKKTDQLIGNANPQSVVIDRPHIECQLTTFPSGPFQ